MATGGQDGNVVIWDLSSVPAETDAGDDNDDNDDDSGVGGRDELGTRKIPEFSQTAAVEGLEGEEPEGGSGRVGVDGGGSTTTTTTTSTTAVNRRDALATTESMSSASGLSDDVGSAGRGGNSDLGLGGKEDGFLGLTTVFRSAPARVFSGHKSDVVDLSWSHSDFLCSASIDHTVMLWHPIRLACCSA